MVSEVHFCKGEETMKRVLSAVIAMALLPCMLCACGSDTVQDANTNTSNQTATESATKTDEDTGSHTLYFRDFRKSKKAVATFFNSSTGKSENVKMKRVSEDKDYCTFSCEGDCTKYNMAYVTCGKHTSNNFAFNKLMSGWYWREDDILPYTEGAEELNYYPEYDEVTLHAHGYDKYVNIWKPDDYDADSADKYSTIYVLDGQIFLANTRYPDVDINGSVAAAEQVKAMMSVSDKKAIVVGIENIFGRDMELIPDIGDSVTEQLIGGDLKGQMDCMTGLEIADFIVNTLRPYVEENYNVHKDALHTAIAGGSLGGLEAFYMAMEYPEVFGTCGAFSASLYEYDDKNWKNYLKDKSFGKDSPFIYFYTGSAKTDTETCVKEMCTRLKDMGYPTEKIALNVDPKAPHDNIYWRNTFSEFLTAMMFRRVFLIQ